MRSQARAALAGLTALGALAGAASAPASAAPLVRLIAASATDPAIDDINGVHHVAIDPAAPRLGRLFVFLPGTGATAQMYSRLVERAASLGYHAVGLAYVNQVAVNVICAGQAGSGCHEAVRREVLLGSDTSPLVEVDADNAAVHRLERLLEHLEAVAPAEDWDAFRDASGQLRWNLVTVAGHSQGAGHAAFAARLFRVARALLFSGTEPAPWTQADDFATPAADFYGLAHRLEGIYDPIQASWDNIGLPGSPTSVDGASPPFGGSHQLHSSTQDCTGDPGSNGFYHNCLCADDWMPLLPDGTPAFQYVWDQLLSFPPAVPATSAPARAWLILCLAVAALGLPGPGLRASGRRDGAGRAERRVRGGPPGPGSA
jgi:hypothetical protein